MTRTNARFRRLFLTFQLHALLAATTVSAGSSLAVPGSVAFLSSYQSSLLLLSKLIAFTLPLLVMLPTLMSRHGLLRWRGQMVRHGALGAFILLAFLFAPLSYQPGYSLVKLVSLLWPLLGVMALSLQYRLCYDNHALSYLMRDLLSFSALFTLLVFGHGVFTHGAEALLLRRNAFSGAIIHPLTVAGVSGIGMLVALYYSSFFATIGLKSQCLRGVIMLLGACLLALILARGVIVSLFVAYLAAQTMLALRHRSERAVLTLAFWGVSCFSALLLPGSGLVPLEDILPFISFDQNAADFFSLTGRVGTWFEAAEAISLKALLVGHGYGIMDPVIFTHPRLGEIWDAHNGFLTVLTGTGIMGLALFLLYLGHQGALLLAQNTLPKGQLAMLFMVYVFILVRLLTDSLFGYQLSFFMALFILLQSLLPAREKREAAAPSHAKPAGAPA